MRQSGASGVLGVWLGGLGVIKGGAGSAYLQPTSSGWNKCIFKLSLDSKQGQLKIVNIICVTGKIVFSKNIIPPRLLKKTNAENNQKGDHRSLSIVMTPPAEVIGGMSLSAVDPPRWSPPVSPPTWLPSPFSCPLTAPSPLLPAASSSAFFRLTLAPR